MKRAVHRAYRRFTGAHPRRPRSRASLAAEIGCDLMLALAVFGMLGGAGVLVWATATGFHAGLLLCGALMIGLGALLLLIWERVAWEPFAEKISEHLVELS
jgi:hypothetical protein